MKLYKPALRYARAYFEAARDGNVLKQAAGDMALVEAVLKKAPELLPFLASLAGKEKKRQQLMEKAFKPYVQDLTWRLIDLLLKRNRLGVLEWVPEVFQRHYDEHEGILKTRIEGVYDLSGEEINAIKEKLEAMTNKKISIAFALNKSLIGGFRLFFGDKLIDGSIQNQLKRLRKNMLAT